MAPDEQARSSASESFELLFTSKIEDFIPLTKYKSKRTGITVYLAGVDGPTVNGYLALATEAHDDDGLPHTLEHLIFLGSEEYPYKGVLDLVANRCMASGTNAWTATDHTCYTVMTAGSEGFLTFLPVYVDHVLYPTLSDAGFITEVHHVNGEGEDAGVVYCEMQGIENSGENLVDRALLRNLYPGRCAYKSETGGAMTNLRESTNNEKVRNYHKQFYRPENLCIIVSGHVTAEELFAALKPVEDKIVAKGLLDKFDRPWQSDVPPLSDSVHEIVQYPCDDEQNGLVKVAFRGPQSKMLSDSVAIDALILYLTDTAISPLRRDFVEVDDPFCSKIAGHVIEYKEGYIELMFENAPKEKMHQIKPKLSDLLQKIASGEEAIDMQRMQSVVHRKILSILNSMEGEPHEFLAQRIIWDFIYGSDNEDLNAYINQIKMLKKIMTSAEDFWLKLLKKYFIDGYSITIVGEPSCSLMQKMTTEETERIEKQRESLGQDGLKRKSEELENAIETNEIPPPDEIIVAFKIPSVESIHFHDIKRCTNHSDLSLDDHPAFPLSEIPFRFQLDDLRTNFAMIHGLLDTSKLSLDLKLYVPLFLELIFESPVLRNGVVIPHDVVVKQLANDTVGTAATLGISCTELRFMCAPYAQVAHVFLQVELEKYECGVRWLHEVLFCTQFTEERVKIIATKMVNDVSKQKREGNFVVKCLINELCYSKESNRHTNNMMRQYTFLTGVLQKLEASPVEVLGALRNLQSVLTSPENITVHLATNVAQLVKIVQNPQNSWKLFLPEKCGAETRNPLHVQHCHELRLAFDQSPSLSAVIALGSIESSFLIKYAPSITSRTHPDLPALLVFLQYLKQLEGPMWRQIRGLGLAYGYGIDVEPLLGIVYLSLFRSTQVLAAYKEALSIVKGHLDESSEEWEATLVESARSSLMFELIQTEETVKSLSVLSLARHLSSLSADYGRKLLKQVSEVTLDDLKRVGRIHLPALFEEEKSWLAVCCGPTKVNEVLSGFKEFSRDLKLTTLENGFMDKL